MPDFILAIDQGTTGTTALLIGHDLRVHGHHTVDFPQYFPTPGWVEHNPMEIWDNTQKVIRDGLAKAGVKGADLAQQGASLLESRGDRVTTTEVEQVPQHETPATRFGREPRRRALRRVEQAQRDARLGDADPRPSAVGISRGQKRGPGTVTALGREAPSPATQLVAVVTEKVPARGSRDEGHRAHY